MTNDNGNQTVPMKFIKESVPVLPDETLDNKWKHYDFLCKNYIISGLEDNLYNVYSNMETSKELWIALERKYKTEDAGLKKFVVAKFLDYKMVANKSVITQVQELQKDFKNYLKHKCKEMSLEDLIVWLRIKDDNKATEKKGCGNPTIMGANIVKDDPQNNRKRKKASGLKSNPSKKRFNGNCYDCGKAGHKSADCRAPRKDEKKDQANMVEKHEDIDVLCDMLSECNLMGNYKEWWIDSGDTRHVCAVREAFAIYAPVGPEKTLSMGNSATAKIEGCGKIFLKMTSGKVVTLNNVFQVSEIRKNLVYAGLLVKNEFKCIFVSDKVVTSKNEIYVGCIFAELVTKQGESELQQLLYIFRLLGTPNEDSGPRLLS
ncbi:uncharacterized protein [Nicotiana sylvestris]|uniref:uncharacterized protein n=1 Tax=Nicotiana sylvestris TaxID=4096 RepID=UPI00388CAF08